MIAPNRVWCKRSPAVVAGRRPRRRPRRGLRRFVYHAGSPGEAARAD